MQTEADVKTLTEAQEDKMRGMLMGVAYADSAGAPCEFKASWARSFDGKFSEKWFLSKTDKYGNGFTYAQGQVTDDTEMTLACLENVAAGYRLERAVASYISFANSGTKSLGTNTRLLFKDYKTPALFFEKFQTRFCTAAAIEASQSNGHLMRASPLALIGDAESRKLATKLDVLVSNPSQVALAVNSLYVELLREFLLSQDASVCAARAYVAAEEAKLQDGPLRECLQQALRPVFTRDLTKNKGWTLHSLAVALWSCLHASSFQEGVVDIIRRGGDTDTNAAIAGALLGARFGAKACLQDPVVSANWDVILKCEPVVCSGKSTAANWKKEPRPQKYHPSNLHSLLPPALSAVQRPAKLKADIAKLETLLEAKRARKARGLVIGIFGSSCSGKTELVKGVKQALKARRNILCATLSQNAFFHRGPFFKGSSGDKFSLETEGFTDWAKLGSKLQEERLRNDVVLVEGFRLPSNPDVMAAVEHWVHVESSLEQVLARRVMFPESWQDVATYVTEAVWPKHLQTVSKAPAAALRLQATSTKQERVESVKKLVLDEL